MLDVPLLTLACQNLILLMLVLPEMNTWVRNSFSTSQSVDDIVNKLTELGLGSLMLKIDISRAFRQLKVDPGDIDLLGLKQDAFIDQLVPFIQSQKFEFSLVLLHSISWLFTHSSAYPILYHIFSRGLIYPDILLEVM